MTLFWTLVLIMAITYVFAVVAMQTIAVHGKRAAAEDHGALYGTDFVKVNFANFGSFGCTMLTLFQVRTFDSIGQSIDR